MPSHGIRLDLEFLAIVLGAVALSFFVTGQVVSNILFSTLIGVLFFLMGLHVDRDKIRQNTHKKKELFIGLAMVYGIVPIIALATSSLVGGGLRHALIAIGVSTAAIGAPVVWSNIGKGDDGTALIISSLSLFLGIGIIPALLISLGSSVPILELAGKNILLLGVPLALGFLARDFDTFLIDDMRHHFSKLGLWLLILIMAVQLHLSFGSSGLSIISDVVMSIPVLTGFVLITFTVGYVGSKGLGVMERKARSIGFVASSKGIAVALFIAAQLSPEAVIYVSFYYFVRQAVCGVIAEFFKHGADIERFFRSNPWIRKNIP